MREEDDTIGQGAFHSLKKPIEKTVKPKLPKRMSPTELLYTSKERYEHALFLKKRKKRK